MGAVQRAAAAHQPEPGAVLIGGNGVWWRWARELRLAEPARPCADSQGRQQYSRRKKRRAGAHAHSLNGITTQAPSTPPIDPDTNTVLATSTPQNIYGPAGNAVAFAPNAISNVGGSQAHTNMQPYLVLNFSIALQGIFPSQT